MKTDFAKAQAAQADGRAAGASKAAMRATARAEAADKIIQAALKLKEIAQAAAVSLNQAHLQRALLKEEHGKQVVDLLEKKLGEIELEDEPDVVIEVEADTTTTEDERDEAQRLANLLQAQLLQLQQATAIADEKIAQQAAELERVKGTAAPAAIGISEDDAKRTEAAMLADLRIDFPADAAQVPAVDESTLTAKQTATLDNLEVLFAAVPWGGQLPAVTFHLLGAEPSFVHTLVGDAIWKACWRDRHHCVNSAQFIPFKMAGILKWMMSQRGTKHAAAKQEEGKAQYEVVEAEAKKRRLAGRH